LLLLASKTARRSAISAARCATARRLSSALPLLRTRATSSWIYGTTARCFKTLEVRGIFWGATWQLAAELSG